MNSFSCKIFKLGINPDVGLSEKVLDELFEQSGKTKGSIPVRNTLKGKPFSQTLVKYQGAWRLYVHTPMRRDSGVDVGDAVEVEIEFEPKT